MSALGDGPSAEAGATGDRPRASVIWLGVWLGCVALLVSLGVLLVPGWVAWIGLLLSVAGIATSATRKGAEVEFAKVRLLGILLGLVGFVLSIAALRA